MLKRNVPHAQFTIKPELPRKSTLDWQWERVSELAELYDHVYWILDLDVILAEEKVWTKGGLSPLKKFLHYQAKASKNYSNVHLLINNPCLEFWFLLHFEDIRSIFPHCDAVRKALKRHIPAYDKNLRFFTQGTDIFKLLRSSLPLAVERSREIGLWDIDHPMRPVAEIGGLVQKLSGL